MSLGIKKLNDFCCMVIRVIGIVFTGYIFLQGLFTICCIQRVEERTYYMANNTVRQLAGICLFAFFVYLLNKKTTEDFWAKYGKKISGVIMGAVLVFFAAWIMNTRFLYFGDMEKVYMCAGMLLDKNPVCWQAGGYAFMWPQQNGLIIFVSVLLKFFSADTSYIVFYFFNLLMYGGMFIAMFFCMDRLFGTGHTKFVQTVMVMLYFPYGFYITLLYGDLIGFSLGCMAVAFLLDYLDRKRFASIVLCAVLMGLSVVFKQNQLILFVAMVIIFVVEIIKDYKNIKTIGALVLFAVTVIFFMVLPGIVIESILYISIDDANSRWANIAMGIQECDKAPGWYNCYEEEIFAKNNYDGEKTAAAAKEDFFERVDFFKENPSYAWEFFNKKLASEWNNPTFEGFHIQNWRHSMVGLNAIVSSSINDGGKINILLILMLDIFQSIVLFGVIIYLVCDDSKDIKKLIFVTAFIGGFIFFTFWEAKCRYAAPFYVMLIPYAYPGYLKLFERKTKKPVITCAALIFMVLAIAFSNNGFVCNAFKLNSDTESYYDYIHEFDKNFEWLRF